MDGLNKVPLFEQIHALLWDKIGKGEIAPGQRLKDIEWARTLNVSRTPVREAMRKMHQEGVLIPLQQGGYEVRRVDRAGLIGLYRCRAALEALAAEDAAAACDEAAAAALCVLIDDCDTAIARGDLDEVFKLNTNFHSAVLDLSGNEHLKTLLRDMQRMILFYRKSLLRLATSGEIDRQDYLDRMRAKQLHHRDILAALRIRDGAAAAQLMQDHLRETVNELLPALPADAKATPAAA